jgi:hypothetical protein
MKLFQVIILISCASFLLCLTDGETPCDTNKADSKEFCFKRGFDPTEIQKKAKYCCYIDFEILGENGHSCLPLTEDDYTKLDRSFWKVDVNKNVWFMLLL